MGKKIPSCYNCVFAYLDQEITLKCYEARILNWPACANHPESYGRMKRTPPRGMCPNYRPKPDKPEGDIRQIALGDGFTAYVDAADFEWLSQWTWYLCNGYAGRRNKEIWIYMHREIMKPPKGMDIDHKNHNKLDNTRENLRVCTRAENIRNRRKPRNVSSRFWGVSYIKARARYMAFVSHEGKVVSCGCFLKELDAARAHDTKAVELHGEFARLNFPEEWPPERRAAIYAQRDAAKKESKRRRRRTEGRGRRTAKEKNSRAETRGRRGNRKTRGRTTEDRGRATSHGARVTASRSRNARKERHREEKPRRGRRVGS
jgi:hypothetical protein